jgi:pSer/pThr/pTyr-binding forkhead associated (FHA) protein
MPLDARIGPELGLRIWGNLERPTELENRIVSYLDIISPQKQLRLVLSDTTVTIGRSPTNVLPIDEAQSSRAHCVIEKTIDGYRLRDLDSRNGTWQNSEKIEQVILVNKDTFHIGATSFTLHHGDPPAT